MTVAQLARWLPAIEDARRWSQSLAVLDAIVCEDRFYRYFSFDSQFGPGQAQASMYNGQGDEYSITFGEYGALALGLDHESQLGSVFAQNPLAQWPALFTGIPPVLAKVARQCVRTLEGLLEVTVAVWRVAGDGQWRHGPVEYPPNWEHHCGDPDGSGWLFERLDGRASTYLEYASEYFERQLPAEAVTAIFEHRPVTAELVRALNPGRVLDDLIRLDLNEIGYPHQMTCAGRALAGRRMLSRKRRLGEQANAGPTGRQTAAPDRRINALSSPTRSGSVPGRVSTAVTMAMRSSW